MKRIALALGLALSLSLSSCATVSRHLPTVISAIMDGTMILDSLEHFVTTYFKLRPDEALEKKIDDAMARSRSALNAALRISQGAEKLDQAQIDEAFKDFRMAYTELLVLLGPLGVSAQGDTMKATPGGMVVPQPLALSVKLQ